MANYSNKHRKKKRMMKLWQIYTADILVTGIALVVFALFHHVLPSTLGSESEGIVIENLTAQAAVAETETEETVTEEKSADAVSDTENEDADPAQTETDMTGEDGADITVDGEEALPEEETGEQEEAVQEEIQEEVETEIQMADKFADKYTAEVVVSENHYSSPDICIDISEYETGEGSNKMHYYVADIYVRDVKCFQSYFAGNRYTRGAFAYDIEKLSEDSNAIVAINGDYFSYQSGTCVLRNGVLYRYPTTDADICVLYYDGTMKTYRAAEIQTTDEIDAALTNAWQGWSFGPALLDGEGNVYEGLASYTTIAPKNPRTGIGYYETGHYCFVVVDGRQSSSNGARIEEFAQIFSDLGCKYAYNLDGGGSSRMAFQDETISNPFEKRTLPDIILITEYEGSIAQQAEQAAAEENKNG